MGGEVEPIVRGDPVPITDHISRYCEKRYLDGKRVTGAAFRLRQATAVREAETYLSVNWLEFLSRPSRKEEIAEIQRILDTKFRRIHKRDLIAVGNVEELLTHVRSKSPDRRALNVVHWPEKQVDESHSAIYGLSVNDDILYGELIAEKFQDTYPAQVSSRSTQDE
ncbi:MAG: hypothetical protein F4010_02135 [Cenarchaeum sp. SB0669_bin_11]|nr:hypothetical protein [Gammaproteobacteria bacterium]MYL10955.1 hypothetical protein [Cenarchaeum sp. SB0669_bin_11]